MSQVLIQTEPAPVSEVAGDPPLSAVAWGSTLRAWWWSHREQRGTAQWHDHRLVGLLDLKQQVLNKLAR